MSGTTISTVLGNGITLSLASENPVTITGSGAILTNSYVGILGVSLATPWSIDNDGKISATGVGAPHSTTGIGIELEGSGQITNGSAGGQQTYEDALISGERFGIFLAGAKDNVTNFGTIDALGHNNVNVIYNGIYVGPSTSSSIVNASMIDTTALIEGANNGVYDFDFGTALGNAYVENFGSIIASTKIGSNIYGVALVTQATVVNHGLIEGYGGINISPLFDGTASPVVIVNSGTISAEGPHALAIRVYLEGTQSGRLIVDPGAVFDGNIDFSHSESGSTALELASGNGVGTIDGIGSQFEYFTTIDFDAGAAWVVSGNSAGLAAGEVISGFAAGDSIILDGVDATRLDLSGSEVELVAGTLTYALDLLGAKKAPLLLEASASASTISEALAGISIKAGEFEVVAKGARETGDTIAGGTLDLHSGAKVSGMIGFSGTGGTLVIGGTVMPGHEITGFGAGEKIKLAGVKYVAGASVTVAKDGVVTIEDGGKAYNLNIAGVVTGETGFKFGPGAILTTTDAAKMGFLTPAAVGTVTPAASVRGADFEVMPGSVASGWLGSAGRVEGAGRILLEATLAAGPAVWLDMRGAV
jgi:hypothetical protein